MSPAIDLPKLAEVFRTFEHQDLSIPCLRRHELLSEQGGGDFPLPEAFQTQTSTASFLCLNHASMPQKSATSLMMADAIIVHYARSIDVQCDLLALLLHREGHQNTYLERSEDLTELAYRCFSAEMTIEGLMKFRSGVESLHEDLDNLFISLPEYELQELPQHQATMNNLFKKLEASLDMTLRLVADQRTLSRFQPSNENVPLSQAQEILNALTEIYQPLEFIFDEYRSLIEGVAERLTDTLDENINISATQQGEFESQHVNPMRGVSAAVSRQLYYVQSKVSAAYRGVEQDLSNGTIE
jgi:hypothetical protein